MVIYGQESTATPPKPVEVKWSGFILNQMFYDSRKNVEAIDGLVLLFPLPKDTAGALGKDLNAVSNLNLLSLASRLRANISGPDALGAQTSGFIEFDFTARANSASVRLRQAWVKLNWKRTELLAGRSWHPMSSTDVTPSNNALSWGAPFQPFNRSDQITLTHKFGKTYLIGALLFQNDYALNGPSGKSYLCQTNSLLPEMHLQVKYKSGITTVGAGTDYKRLLPRTHTVSAVNGTKHTTHEGLNSLAFLTYAQFKPGKWTISAKSILAFNMSESLMAGAYGVSAFDSLTGHEKYTPYKHFFIWGNIVYGSALKFGVFAGYLKNLGATKNLFPGTTIYGLGEKIASMYRITPFITYTSGKIMLGGEIECNSAAYGSIDHADSGKLKNAENINAFRVLLTMYYNF
jgi:hypothetical protein